MQRPLRVLNLLNSSHRRGAEAFALDLGTALARLNVDVQSVALARGDSPVNHTVDELGFHGINLLRSSRELSRMCRDAHVIIGHGGRTLFAGALMRSMVGTPFVYRVIGEASAWARSPARRARVSLALRRADIVAGYVASELAVIVREFGVSEDKIRVVPKGVDVLSFTPTDRQDSSTSRALLGLSSRTRDEHVALYVGALSAKKNVEQIVRSVARMNGVHLLIVGSGPKEDDLRRLAATHSAAVTFLGALEDPRVAYSAADVVVLTSRTEGVPSVLLEAALMGLPAVATRVGGVPDTVIDGETGLLVPLDDDEATASAISYAIENKATIGRAARTHALAHWDINTVAKTWLTILHDLPDARSTRRVRRA